MPSLADIRARLAAQDTKSKGNFTQGESAVYAHWNIDDDTIANLRFLDDADTSNPYFWVERNLFKFPFMGVKGNTEHGVEPNSKEVIVQIPCMEMWGDKDAVLDEVRTWFKDPTMEDMGRKYWKKRSYLFQGFVREDPMEGKEGYKVPENPIRRFIISPQIFTLIKNSLMDPDIENLPTDQDAGLDFRVKKTQKGSGYADYSNSSWSRKESALTQEELDAIDEHGLFELADFLPKKPDAETLKIIMEMFEASVEGEAYDIEKWGKFYTPYGVSKIDDKAKSDDTAESKPKPKVEPKSETKAEKTTLEEDVTTAEKQVKEASKVVEEVEEDESAGDKKAKDILAMIRSRQK